MIIVLVHRPESVTDVPSEDGNPFEGIEILGVFNTEEKANAEIDAHYNNTTWQFHIDEVSGQFIRFEDGRED